MLCNLFLEQPVIGELFFISTHINVHNSVQFLSCYSFYSVWLTREMYCNFDLLFSWHIFQLATCIVRDMWWHYFWCYTIMFPLWLSSVVMRVRCVRNPLWNWFIYAELYSCRYRNLFPYCLRFLIDFCSLPV